MDRVGIILTTGVVAVLGLVTLRVQRWWRSWVIHGRMRRATHGERRAEALLRRSGYRIDERQANQTFVIVVDGKRQTVSLRADLLVSRRGRRYVAEVKTGRSAPSINNISTRRQLLEYLIAYEVDGVLLVTPETDAVHVIDFLYT